MGDMINQKLSLTFPSNQGKSLSPNLSIYHRRWTEINLTSICTLLQKSLLVIYSYLKTYKIYINQMVGQQMTKVCQLFFELSGFAKYEINLLESIQDSEVLMIFAFRK